MKRLIVFLTLFTSIMLVAVNSASALTVSFVAGDNNKPVTGIEVCIGSCQLGNWFDHKGQVVVPGKLSGKTLTWKRVGKSTTTQTGQLTLDGSSHYTVKLVEVLTDSRGQAIDEFETQLLHVLNQRRAERGLAPLQLETELNLMATYHANYLDTNQITGHVGASGSNSQFRASEAGVVYPWGVAETVQKNYAQSAENIMDAFQNSSAHWDILMGSDFRTVGISHVGQYTVINPKQTCQLGCEVVQDRLEEVQQTPVPVVTHTPPVIYQEPEHIPEQLPNSKSKLPNPKGGAVKENRTKQQLVKATVRKRKNKTVRISLKGLTKGDKVKVQNKKRSYKLSSKGKKRKVWKTTKTNLKLSGKLPRKFQIVISDKNNVVQQIIKVI